MYTHPHLMYADMLYCVTYIACWADSHWNLPRESWVFDGSFWGGDHPRAQKNDPRSLQPAGLFVWKIEIQLAATEFWWDFLMGLANWCQTDKPFRRWKSVFPPLVITGAWRSIPIIKWFVTREGNICFDPEELANCFGWCFGARGVFFCIPGSHPRKWKGLALLGHPDSNPKPAISGIVRCIPTMVPLWEILILSYISPYL